MIADQFCHLFVHNIWTAWHVTARAYFSTHEFKKDLRLRLPQHFVVIISQYATFIGKQISNSFTLNFSPFHQKLTLVQTIRPY